MDLVEERASVVVEETEDRISNLADDIIHRILSFLDMKYAVQTCSLSKKWKHIWTLTPNLNFNSRLFPSSHHFTKFVKHALLGRNNGTEVSAVEVKFKGSASQSVVKSIVNYAYLHNVRKLNLTLFSDKVCDFPQELFSSHTLKHLSLQVYGVSFVCYCHIQNLAWDFPVLETLNMENVKLSTDNDKDFNLFSKCVNLKELTLHDCSASGLEMFNICAPKLSSLTITGKHKFSKVFNVVASHLQNLTLKITSESRFNFLEMSPEGLNKVNLSMMALGYANEICMWALLDLFPKLHGAKYLILDRVIIQILSSCNDELSHEPCPFHNLECLRINARYLKVPIQVKNYFLGNSPNATFIMDQPQVPQNRSMVNIDAEISQPAEVISEQQAIHTTHLKQNDCIHTRVSHKRSLESVHSEATTSKKVAKLEAKGIADLKAMFEAKMQMQDEVIAKQKAMLDAKIQMQDKLIADQKALFDAKIQMQDTIIAEQKAKLQMLEVTTLQNEKLVSQIIKSKIAELKMQVENGNPDYEAIRVIGRDIKSAMDLVPEILRAVMESVGPY